MGRFAQWVAAAVLVAALAGCTSGKNPDSWEASPKDSPEATFDAVRDAVLKGDVETLWSYYSTRKRTQVKSVEALRREYEQTRSELIMMYTGAKVTFVAQEGNRASAVVVWGNSERVPLAAFVREDGRWLVDH